MPKVIKYDATSIPLLRALIYGKSGVGKTTLLSSAADCEETTPMLVFDAGGNPISLRHCDPAPLIIAIESSGEINPAYNWIRSGQEWEAVAESSHWFAVAVREYFQGWAEDKRQFKMLAVDSITEVQNIIGDEVVGNVAVPPGTLPKAIEGFGSWRKMLDATANVARKLSELPVHVWMTALTRYHEVPSDGTTMYYPFLKGQSSQLVPSYSELLGRLISTRRLPGRQNTALKKAEPEFAQAYNILVLRSGADYDANWKGVDDPPEYILDPSMRKILDCMSGKR